MNRAHVNDIELEYEVRGEGEPVLLIHGAHIANAMAPLIDEPALEGFQLIHYHRRGYAGSSRPAGLTSIEAHADDAAGLLDHLGIANAHVIGHSSGAVVALEVGARHPTRTRSLALLEPALLSGPAGTMFMDVMAPLIARYEAGDAAAAVDGFLALIGRDDWRATIERAVPGGVDQAERDAPTFFENELPVAAAWTFGPDRASAITCPVLSVLGSDSGPLFAEGRLLLHEWFPGCVDADLPGVTHLLQMEATEAVADAVGDFLSSPQLRPRGLQRSLRSTEATRG
jgi:pimeloyl-ACP methyl ester carboxylesterase